MAQLRLLQAHFTYVDDEDMDPDYECSICSCVFVEPAIHVDDGCGFTMCTACVTDLHERKLACPSCRKPLTQCMPDRSLIRFLDKLQVRCAACGVSTGRTRFHNHYHRECRVPCPQQCDAKLTRDQEQGHVRDECPNTSLACPHGCPDRVQRRDLAAHAAVCAHVVAPCARCARPVARQAASAHEALCPNAPVVCPHCDVACVRQALPAHEAECERAPVRCSEPQLCPWTGERKWYAHHVQGCIPATVQPLLAKMQAQFDAQLQRQQQAQDAQMQQHQQATAQALQAQGSKVQQLQADLLVERQKVQVLEGQLAEVRSAVQTQADSKQAFTQEQVQALIKSLPQECKTCRQQVLRNDQRAVCRYHVRLLTLLSLQGLARPAARQQSAPNLHSTPLCGKNLLRKHPS